MKPSFKTCLRLLALMAVAALPLLGTGCTSRGMTITSQPEGAEVSVNRRVVGTTPIRINYTHYGSYRVEVRKERYQTLVKKEKMHTPWYGYDPFTFFADNIIPARINDETYLHYALTDVPEELDRDSLMERATMARDGNVVHPVTGLAINVPLEPRLAPAGAATDTATDVEGPAAAPDLNVPAEVAGEEKPSKTIQEEKPAGPTIARELGLDEEGKEPKTAKPDKKDEPGAKDRRPPKDEMLIYEEKPIEDPAKEKDGKKDEKKPAKKDDGKKKE